MEIILDGKRVSAEVKCIYDLVMGSNCKYKKQGFRKYHILKLAVIKGTSK